MRTPYAKLIINDTEADVTSYDDIPLSISVQFEDADDFQKKNGSDAFSVTLPASLLNSRNANSFHNPSIHDLTSGKAFRSAGNCSIEVNGVELLTGKSFLKSAAHTDRPLSYTYDFVGDNKDWGVELKDVTFYDLLQDITFAFTKSEITSSWVFDGRDEDLPYVFAPVRYRETMGDNDDDMKPEYMRPSLSKYWLLYRAFKSIGYRLKSDFFDTDYFRRQVMPWTWGSFLYSDGTRLDNLDFLAKSVNDVYKEGSIDAYMDLDISNDSTAGAFDNNGSYSWASGTQEAKWTYLTAFSYGNLDATFHFQTQIDSTVSANSDANLKLRWFKNGVQFKEEILFSLNAPTVGRKDFVGIIDSFATVNVNPGDIISCRLFLHLFDTGLGRANIKASCTAFEFEYFTIPLGGTIDFRNYMSLKKFKVLDLLRGVTDEFDLSFRTDAVSKVVYVEPLHPYSLTNDLSGKGGGYILDHFIDWSDKQDLAKESNLDLYSEGERELLFKYKEDSSDGGLKILQERYGALPGSAKYVLPSRYQSGKKEIQNRFFSPVVHYDANQWKAITGIAPQMIALVPENIANTSNRESDASILPKSAYYKGFDYTMGWKFDGDDYTYFPFLFAVNYKPGGEDDPVLSYSDEKIGNEVDGFVIAKGLMKRFFWQRLAIQRNGQFYRTHLRLNNFDVMSLHREFKVLWGNRYERPAIRGYKPLANESTPVELWKWEPVTQEDADNTYPSATMITAGSNAAVPEDIRYIPLKILTSDIPK